MHPYPYRSHFSLLLNQSTTFIKPKQSSQIFIQTKLYLYMYNKKLIKYFINLYIFSYIFIKKNQYNILSFHLTVNQIT